MKFCVFYVDFSWLKIPDGLFYAFSMSVETCLYDHLYYKLLRQNSSLITAFFNAIAFSFIQLF